MSEYVLSSVWTRAPRLDRTHMPMAQRTPLVILLLLAGALAPVPSDAQPTRQQTARASGAATSTVTELADAYVARYKTTFPEGASMAGFADAAADRFTDNSVSALRQWEAFEDSLWTKVAGIAPAQLAGSRDEVTYAQLHELLESSRQLRVCRGELWPANSLFGWQTIWAQLAGFQPVGTESGRRAALARWRGSARYLDREVANMRQGLTLGYTTPAPNIRATLDQLDALVASPVDSLPFMAPAQQDTNAAFRSAFRAVIADSLVPALRRYRDFLRGTYLPKAHGIVTANPNGVACYRALLRANTGVDRDPQDLLREVKEQVARDSVARLDVARSIYPAPPPGTPWDAAYLRTMVDKDSSNLMPSADSIVAFTRAVMARARAALPKYFETVPTADVELQPFPDFQQPTAPGGQYVPGTEDGSRSAVYLYRTSPPVRRIGLAAVVVHETWPGHHLQGAMVTGSTSRHPIALLSSVPGFIEGWGHYSEWLAQEMGVYTEPRDLLGRYQTLAPFLVADIGLNMMGWTPAQAEAYALRASPTAAADRIKRVIPAILGVPGFIASYTVGAMEIQKLRRQAEASFGSKFDIRAFHQLVLQDGPVPLALVRTRVERWTTAP